MQVIPHAGPQPPCVTPCNTLPPPLYRSTRMLDPPALQKLPQRRLPQLHPAGYSSSHIGFTASVVGDRIWLLIVKYFCFTYPGVVAATAAVKAVSAC